MSRIEVPHEVIAAMAVHARNEAPNEACGLVAGSSGQVRFFYPLDNVAPSVDRYVVDPVGHVSALRHAERSGWELIGVFHSHPSGSAIPSATDIAETFEPDWISFISGSGGVRAWQIAGGVPREMHMIQAEAEEN